MITQNDSNILEHAGWYMRCAHYYTQNYATIALRGFSKGERLGCNLNSVHLQSLNPQKINFSIPEDNYLSLGQKIIHKTNTVNGQKVVTDFTLVLDQKYIEQNILIITWDYEKKKFIVHE
jgi:hypothetical protein